MHAHTHLTTPLCFVYIWDLTRKYNLNKMEKSANLQVHTVCVHMRSDMCTYEIWQENTICKSTSTVDTTCRLLSVECRSLLSYSFRLSLSESRVTYIKAHKGTLAIILSIPLCKRWVTSQSLCCVLSDFWVLEGHAFHWLKPPGYATC